MIDADPVKRGRSYSLCRHHAWGGLAILSIVLTVRLIFPSLPDELLFPLIAVIVLYILVWLFMTYRYRKELGTGPASKSPEPPFGEEEVGSGREKMRLKVEKKRVKAELKARKKSWKEE